MSASKLDDGRVGSRIENYSDFWHKDIRKEGQVESDNRLENYTDVVNGVLLFFSPYGHVIGSSAPPPTQGTTTARRNSMSTVGPGHSTSRASTRARRSPRRSLATNTILPHRCPFVPGCVFSTSAAVSVGLPGRLHASRMQESSV